MKKENYGIPTGLLNCLLYAVALYICVNSFGSLWVLIGLTVVAFTLGFSSSVKKTLIQAGALVLMVIALKIVFDFIGCFFSFANSTELYEKSLYAKYNDVVEVIMKIVDIIAYIVFVLLGLMALAKKDLFVGPVHMAVDGFIPRPVYQQQQPYNGQPQQQFNGQPQQQFNGQPQQQFNGQPQQFNGQPQQPK